MEVLLYVLTVLLVHGQQASGQGAVINTYLFNYQPLVIADCFFMDCLLVMAAKNTMVFCRSVS